MAEHLIRTMVVDKDVESRTRIRRFLGEERDVHLAAECNDGREASRKLVLLKPDILVLEVDLPGMSGFELLKSAARIRTPYVIFTSACEKYALRAFEFNAVHYLVKPLEQHTFREAVTRARHNLERDRRTGGSHLIADSAPSVKTAESIRPFVDRVPIKHGRRINLLNTAVIHHIIADGNCTDLHMVTGQVIHGSERISQIEVKLPTDRFQRIQRSVIVNLDYVREILPNKGRHEFVMNNGERFMSGVAYQREFDGLFAFWNKRPHAA